VVATGDTVWLRGGTYTNGLTHPYFYIQSPTAAGVTFRPYLTEIAIIDGAFYVAQVDDTTIRDLIFTRLSGSRVTTETGSAPSDIPYADAISGFAANLSVINCTFVNVIGNAFMVNNYASNAVLYGNVITLCGWQGGDRGHGHGFYAQPPNLMLIQNNIVNHVMGYGAQFYGSDTATITNGNFSWNTVYGNATIADPSDGGQLLAGGGAAVGGLVVNSNSFYASPRLRSLSATSINLGYGAQTNWDFTALQNYIVGRAQFNFAQGDFENNVLYSPAWQMMYIRSVYIPGNWTMDNNTYVCSALSTAFQLESTTYALADWKTATGKDTSSTITSDAPAANVVRVVANVWEPGRGSVAVYNWEGLNNVSVDLSSVLTNGEPYEIRHAMDPLGMPVKWGTWTSGNVSVPMTNLPVATLTGLTLQATNTGPEFASFLVLTSGRFPNAQNGGVGGESGSSAPPQSFRWVKGQ
jgi:hypothetical protein